MSRADDRKMKELADRLVAMSPEPPPYPEEVSVTHREDSKPRPVLVFAGAALVVLLLAAIPLLLSRGGGEVDPVASSTTSTVPTTVTTQPQASTTVTTEAPATTTTVPATTTTTAPGVEAVEAVLYAVQTPENSFTGNPALVAFHGTVVPDVPFEEPMNPAYPGLYALTSENLFLPDGFSNMVPAAVEILGVTPGEHTVTVDMNEAFLAGSGSGLLGDFTMLNQMISTASAFGEIESVLFTVNGEPVTAFGSEGLDLSEPQGRDAYLDQLNSVNVDSPIQGQGDESLRVAGFANVFEATVSLEVVDATGNVVQEDFATATCGTGCWGAYEFEVDYPFVGDETIRVFWHSAEDGSPSDVVSIPVLWDDPDGWDFTSHPGTP
ncbi:MAG TPA: Gmad2 immunoglobulin-like domain-containing protein [Acidimicrobiia bacterium]|nr:Gmad2 immunoglobulin-like domain-containing protein [Acidimicrobiia bacterium]